ncbi:MAG TPA: tRNA dihydrouridine synthase DusB [Treponemataceae bacterium]|nr:tRNA dihydrouridine synthase DusB [Treponemataceae bacterium]
MDKPPLYHPVRIGPLALSGNIFLAPVAGYSDRAFRSLCIEYGASFTYTEMVSSEAITRDCTKTSLLLRRAAEETCYAVQLFGSDPSRMADATERVIDQVHPECIDINAGCPVPKVVKTGAGSSLTRDPQRLHAIVSAMVNRAGSIPITVKIRSGWDDSKLSWEEAARAAIEAGAQAITLHPRTRAQGYEGRANWDLLSNLASLVHSNYPGIPVFGSGDLFKPEDAQRMLDHTGCDAVMFARGATGNPFIFHQTRLLLTTGAYEDIPAKERMSAGWKELGILVEDLGEERACREMRKRFCAYSRGIEGGAELRSSLVLASSCAEYQSILTAHSLFQGMTDLANSTPSVYNEP